MGEPLFLERSGSEAPARSTGCFFRLRRQPGSGGRWPCTSPRYRQAKLPVPRAAPVSGKPRSPLLSHARSSIWETRVDVDLLPWTPRQGERMRAGYSHTDWSNTVDDRAGAKRRSDTADTDAGS
jgi:hypothetical protein